MFSPDETPGRRRNWGVVYTLLSGAGLAVMVPLFTPNVGLSEGITLAWGALVFIGYGVAAFSAYTGRRFVWLENSGSWLGNAGITVYVIAVGQLFTSQTDLNKLPGLLALLALLVILVSRSFRLQRHLKTVRRIKEIVRIAHRNDSNE